MEEKMRVRLLIAAAVANVILLLLWASSCSKVSQYQKARTKEMDVRLDREKQLAELEKAQSALDQNLKKAGEEIAGLRASLDTLQKSLTQEQLMNASLKSELDKINKAKEALEAQLKELLGKGKVSDKPKK
ncbi:MAG: hypothetical protein PHT59_01965 [Candidatus Omnitrophica bacterium]|nr:hypothetical protein [Candidatus Omnitrophota bacterium]